MKRPDWTQKLFEYLAAQADKPFAWGSNDCIMFAAGAVKAMTGVDYTKDFPPYNTSLAAGRLLQEHGGIEGIMDKFFDRTPTNFMQRGDLALLRDQPHSPTVGVVAGPTIWMPGEKCVVYVPIYQAEIAWRVD